MDYNELHKELTKWKSEGVISDEQYSILDGRYKPKQFNIPRIHNAASPQRILTFFIIAIVILGTLSWIVQEFVILKGIKYETISSAVVFAALAFFVIVGLYLGDYIAGRPIRVLRYTGKLIILISCLLTTFTIFYIDIKVSKITGTKFLGTNWATFMLASVIILIPIAYKMREKVVLAYSIVLFVVWFISETKIHTGGYINNWLGMTLPARLFLLSWVFLGLGYIHRHNVLKKINLSKDFYNLHKTYYISGLLLIFIPSLKASWGSWLVNPFLSLKAEAMVFVVLVLGLALGCIYIGLKKNSRLFLNFGIVFFVAEVYGKFYEVFHGRINNMLFYITSLVILIALGSMVEYVIRNKEELRAELLAKK